MVSIEWLIWKIRKLIKTPQKFVSTNQLTSTINNNEISVISTCYKRVLDLEGDCKKKYASLKNL